MAKKKKRRPATGYRSEASRTRSSPPATSPARAAAPRSVSPWGSLFGGRRGERRPSVQPPVAVSFARGVSVVGRSPLLPVITFLSIFGLWLGFSGYGVITTAAPQAMVLLISLPPIHTILDIQFLARGRTVGAGQVVAFSVGLALVRAALMSLWTSLIVEAFLRPEGPPDLRAVFRRAARSFVPMTGVEVGFLMLATVAIFLVTGFLGSLGVIVALVAGLYFFSYAPVIVGAEGVGAVQAAQLSIRAARLPGPQHLLLITTYLAVTLFVAVVTPGSRVAAATPSVAVWAFALFVGFLHVAVLGALTYRWLLLRGLVLEQAAEARPRQRSRTGA